MQVILPTRLLDNLQSCLIAVVNFLAGSTEADKKIFVITGPMENFYPEGELGRNYLENASWRLRQSQGTAKIPAPVYSVQLRESFVRVIIAGDGMTVADERVKHHRRIHEDVIGTRSPSDRFQRLFLRRG